MKIWNFKVYLINVSRRKGGVKNKERAQIQEIQEENRKQYDKNKKESNKYEEGELVVIKRTRDLGPDLKLKSKFLGHYSVSEETKEGPI